MRYTLQDTTLGGLHSKPLTRTGQRGARAQRERHSTHRQHTHKERDTTHTDSTSTETKRVRERQHTQREKHSTHTTRRERHAQHTYITHTDRQIERVCYTHRQIDSMCDRESNRQLLLTTCISLCRVQIGIAINKQSIIPKGELILNPKTLLLDLRQQTERKHRLSQAHAKSARFANAHDRMVTKLA